MFRIITLVSFLVLSLTARAQAQNTVSEPQSAAGKTVRFVYMVPEDRPFKAEYYQAIERAAKDVQAWYRQKLGGRTFHLNSPVVEVFRPSRLAGDYDKPVADKGDTQWNTFWHTFKDTNDIINQRAIEGNNIWIVYVDAPGDTGGGMSGFAVLPDHDLLGLTGKLPEFPNRQRWIGGLAHELGHALGLAHPSGGDDRSLMMFGYGDYPNTYLTTEDLKILGEQPFIQANVPEPKSLGTFSYDSGNGDRGYFVQVDEVRWEERKNGTPQGVIQFVLSDLQKDYVVLNDPLRSKFEVLLPLKGGTSYWRFGNASSLNTWYQIGRSEVR